ncbi:EPIDERMAL PATTERNING FACTOR-like protein 2 [Lotus japonicus]|uniref:EPIDERMAL PATTERNING FACTOR-like protein 2 n=1 Tax=Lotus japonicus TaxID=34305 RepID=UPI00258753ED|nr:EPIDERMAL PATTERNING FACTOR-like protein 2 [Lotus japonicus]
MRRDHGVICDQRLNFVTLSLLFLIISSWTIEGRKTFKQNDFYQTIVDEKAMARAQIGSRPPNCETRCRTCKHCEAIQVPTNPKSHNHQMKPSMVSTVAYTKGDDGSNYKPMSWKCKCGNLIFNP